MAHDSPTFADTGRHVRNRIENTIYRFFKEARCALESVRNMKKVLTFCRLDTKSLGFVTKAEVGS